MSHEVYIIRNKRTGLSKIIYWTDYTHKELNKIVNFYLAHKGFSVYLENNIDY